MKWIYQDPSIFEVLNKLYLNDLQLGKAMLLIDQSVEGYHTEELWKWFHSKCKIYNIDPNAIIYATGNQQAEDQYRIWAIQNNIKEKINVLPSIALSYYITQTYLRNKLDIKFDNLISYKTENNIKLYNCTNLRSRPHRVINFLNLVQTGLITDGLISIQHFDDWQIQDEQILDYGINQKTINQSKRLVPMSIDHKQKNDTEFSSFITRILDDVYKNTWLTLVTESTYFEQEASVFISEKTFKAIAAMHPFIIVGSKNSLKYLKKLGYKTFDGFIDESYDELDDTERFKAIVDALNKIKAIPNKKEWYNSMRDVLEHNQRLFLSMQPNKQENAKIVNFYKKYFNL